MNFVIRQIQECDIELLTEAFYRLNKSRDQFELFWRAPQAGNRVTLLACAGQETIGHTNLVWISDYKPFQEMDIPEINNMHILDHFQNGTSVPR